jgi:hypothetical protein
MIDTKIPVRSFRLKSSDNTDLVSNNDITVPMGGQQFVDINSGVSHANLWLASINLPVADEQKVFNIYMRDIVSPSYLNVRPVGFESLVLIGKYYKGVVTKIPATVEIASLKASQFRVARADPSEGFSSGGHEAWDVVISFQLISPFAHHHRI